MNSFFGRHHSINVNRKIIQNHITLILSQCKKIRIYIEIITQVRHFCTQRLILNLGSVNIPSDQYKELANCIESLLTGQIFGPGICLSLHLE